MRISARRSQARRESSPQVLSVPAFCILNYRNRADEADIERDRRVRPEDTTPQHVVACQAMMERPGGYFNAGAFTPFLLKETGAPLPCQRPPWSKLVAVNARTGRVVWDSVLGQNDLLPEDKRMVGNSGSAGPTATAGGSLRGRHQRSPVQGV